MGRLLNGEYAVDVMARSMRDEEAMGSSRREVSLDHQCRHGSQHVDIKLPCFAEKAVVMRIALGGICGLTFFMLGQAMPV